MNPWDSNEESLENAPEIARGPDAPSHYSRLFPEPISVINGWNLNFNIGNVVKYCSRYMTKGDPVGDLEKAWMYIAYEIDRIKNNGT